MYFGILMIILGVLVFLYGLYLFLVKNAFLPRYPDDKVPDLYRLFVGKTVMFVSLSSIIGGILALIIQVEWIAFLVMIALFALFLFLSIKLFHKNNG